MWSATKYALRIAQRLEYQNLVSGINRENKWQKAIKNGMPTAKETAEKSGMKINPAALQTRRAVGRIGGNLRR